MLEISADAEVNTHNQISDGSGCLLLQILEYIDSIVLLEAGFVYAYE